MVATEEDEAQELTDAERARLVARFVEALDASGKSSNALAKETGVDRRTIDRLRKGERIPRPEKLGRLVQPLGVSLDWIITGEDAREHVMRVSEPSSPAYRTNALAQSAVGFLFRLRASGLEDWMARQPPHTMPSLAAALAALDAYDAARASGLLLHSADGRPVMDWAGFFARTSSPNAAPTTTRDVLAEAEASMPLTLDAPRRKSTKPKRLA